MYNKRSKCICKICYPLVSLDIQISDSPNTNNGVFLEMNIFKIFPLNFLDFLEFQMGDDNAIHGAFVSIV